ncbi:MAG: polyphosphate polymerase domain-containing protein [Defluviitaleaceae bacterium]|nr:polyphosphate polymerase domain-containing protein [Defluviitaleaceae bacterium]
MQLTFKRYEYKYLVTHKQAEAVTATLLEYMVPDKYGTYWVQNLYYDTDNWDVICTSMEKPLYKEKLRLRCYGIPDDSSNVFLELKKKYLGEVNKRRVALPISSLSRPIREVLDEETAQIARELAFYMQTHPVEEKMFIAFLRTAYSGIEDAGLRVTFDNNIRYRRDNLGFSHPEEGQDVLHEDYSILEIKTRTGIPLWLSRLLSDNTIYKISYSKYGTCFMDYQVQKGVVSLNV